MNQIKKCISLIVNIMVEGSKLNVFVKIDDDHKQKASVLMTHKKCSSCIDLKNDEIFAQLLKLKWKASTFLCYLLNILQVATAKYSSLMSNS